MSRFIFFTLGSYGDVIPPLSIAKELVARSHQVLFCTNEYFSDLVQSHGLEFRAIPESGDYETLIKSVNVHRHISLMKALRDHLGSGPVAGMFQLLADLEPDENDILVSYFGNLGLSIFCENRGLSFVSLLYSPSPLRSLLSPARYRKRNLLPRLPLFARKLIYQTFDTTLDFFLKGDVLQACDQSSLILKGKLSTHLHSKSKVLALFPSEFIGKVPEDWPGSVTVCGFPFLGRVGSGEMSEELESFLADGNSPVVLFTPGTPNSRSKDFFSRARIACESLGIRGIFCTVHEEQLPPKTPGFYYAKYLSFASVLPRVSGIVHHGGIGTSANSLRAGIPQLIVPWGVDQWDNSQHLQRLGVGVELPRSQNLQKSLEALLSKETVLRAEELASREGWYGGAAQAASQLEALSNEGSQTGRIDS